MKTPIYTLVLALTWCAIASTSTYAKSAEEGAAADSVLLSQTTEGDYLIRRYKVKSQGDNHYTVHYQINAARLATSLSGNDRELREMARLFDRLRQDTTVRVHAATITGYASPDGSEALNASLAKRRAQDLKKYLDRTTDFSKRYAITLNSVPEDWEMFRSLVAQSAVPDKEEVLRIIDGNRSAAAKEQALKQMPTVWEYMRQYILPPLRRAEIKIEYGNDAIVVVRNQIRRQRPEPVREIIVQEVCDPCGYLAYDDGATGILVEMPGCEQEFPQSAEGTRYAYAPERVDRYADAEIRSYEKFSKRESRVARRAARREAREAARIAKAEAKAARQFARNR